MANFFEMKQQRAHALNKADAILKLAETSERELTASEQQDVDICMTTVGALTLKIQKIESKNTLAPLFKSMGGVALLSQEKSGGPRLLKGPERNLSHDYVEAFFSHVASKGTRVDVALYEGSDGSGGYAVPLIVDSQIVPLAPTDMGVREVATVIPTVMDIKIPRATTISTAAAKAEGTGDGTKLFTDSQPVLDQFTLSRVHGRTDSHNFVGVSTGCPVLSVLRCRGHAACAVHLRGKLVRQRHGQRAGTGAYRQHGQRDRHAGSCGRQRQPAFH